MGLQAWTGASHVPFPVRYPMSLSLIVESVLGHVRDMGQPLAGPNVDEDETGRENLPPARPWRLFGQVWLGRPAEP